MSFRSPQYAAFNAAALAVLAPGGLLITHSCSGAVARSGQLREVVEEQKQWRHGEKYLVLKGACLQDAMDELAEGVRVRTGWPVATVRWLETGGRGGGSGSFDRGALQFEQVWPAAAISFEVCDRCGCQSAQIRLWSEGRGGVPIYKLVIALMEDGFKTTWLAE